MIVGAEAISWTETTRLSRRGHGAGRLSVDVDVDPTVDQLNVLARDRRALTATGRHWFLIFRTAENLILKYETHQMMHLCGAE